MDVRLPPAVWVFSSRSRRSLTRARHSPRRTAIKFLTDVGQICSPTRQEFILLSDALGLSALVDSMNHPTKPPATEATVLGPFFTEDAADVSSWHAPDDYVGKS